MLERINRDDAFHFAAAYRDLGFSVIPLSGKAPALSSWKEFQSRRATEQEIRRWFSGHHAEYNIGIVTGQISDLIVVDADTVADAHWWLENHPETPLTTITGRGGRHFYYRYPLDAHIGNRAKLFERCIDLRGEGGYVVAPESTHPATKQRYRWSEASLLENYSLTSIPVFDPAWIALDHSSHQQSDFTTSILPDSPRSRHTEQRIRGLLKHLDKEVTDRSHRDFAVVCGLLRLGVSAQEVQELVKQSSKFAERQESNYLEATIENAMKSVLKR